jgi:hypothetical protein
MYVDFLTKPGHICILMKPRLPEHNLTKSNKMNRHFFRRKFGKKSPKIVIITLAPCSLTNVAPSSVKCMSHTILPRCFDSQTISDPFETFLKLNWKRKRKELICGVALSSSAASPKLGRQLLKHFLHLPNELPWAGLCKLQNKVVLEPAFVCSIN